MNTRVESITKLVIDVIGDRNDMNWKEGVGELKGFPIEQVVEVLNYVLFDKGETIKFWCDIAEGICEFLLNAGISFVAPCLPTLACLLFSTHNTAEFDTSFILDILGNLESIDDYPFLIPAIIESGHILKDISVDKQIEGLINKFSKEHLSPYNLILSGA